ncbi:MAG: acetolactate synthase small subunit [Lachnospiraceae bacterium]|nr:acetolactate synthase small subunit [Lachnospiraceae bacterium]
MKKRILSLLVVNSSGVLSRVSGMFSRRGYNIDSLTVGVTEDPKYSRMTVVVSGDDRTLDQIEKQLYKLEDVLQVTELEDGVSVCRELVLIRVKADKTEKQQIIAVAHEFRANIVDVAKESLMIELTGNMNKVNAFLSLLDGFEVMAVVRTGVTGLMRGNYSEE